MSAMSRSCFDCFHINEIEDASICLLSARFDDDRVIHFKQCADMNPDGQCPRFDSKKNFTHLDSLILGSMKIDGDHGDPIDGINVAPEYLRQMNIVAVDPVGDAVPWHLIKR
jgi:hypothetical protein